MLDGVPFTVEAGVTVVLFGGWFALFWLVRLLFTGKMATGRELSAKDKRIEKLESALEDRDSQIKEALKVLPEVAEVLRKFHVAATQALTPPPSSPPSPPSQRESESDE